MKNIKLKNKRVRMRRKCGKRDNEKNKMKIEELKTKMKIKR